MMKTIIHRQLILGREHALFFFFLIFLNKNEEFIPVNKNHLSFPTSYFLVYFLIEG